MRVFTGSDPVCYAELDRRANAVAWGLAGRRDERVGLLLGHDATMLVGLLGTLKAGCAYVPLDPDAPVSRLQKIIKDAGINVVVSDPRFVDLLSDVEVQPVTGATRDEAPEATIAP